MCSDLLVALLIDDHAAKAGVRTTRQMLLLGSLAFCLLCLTLLFDELGCLGARTAPETLSREDKKQVHVSWTERGQAKYIRNEPSQEAEG